MTNKNTISYNYLQELLTRLQDILCVSVANLLNCMPWIYACFRSVWCAQYFLFSLDVQFLIFPLWFSLSFIKYTHNTFLQSKFSIYSNMHDMHISLCCLWCNPWIKSLYCYTIAYQCTSVPYWLQDNFSYHPCKRILKYHLGTWLHKNTQLLQCTYSFCHIMLYEEHFSWAGFELTTVHLFS